MVITITDFTPPQPKPVSTGYGRTTEWITTVDRRRKLVLDRELGKALGKAPDELFTGTGKRNQQRTKRNIAFYNESLFNEEAEASCTTPQSNRYLVWLRCGNANGR